MSFSKTLVSVVLGTILLVVVFGLISDAIEDVEDDSDCTSESASYFATVFVEDAVKGKIRNPHLADLNTRTRSYEGDGRWAVGGIGDTTNIFGGPQRFRFGGSIQCHSIGDERKWGKATVVVFDM